MRRNLPLLHVLVIFYCFSLSDFATYKCLFLMFKLIFQNVLTPLSKTVITTTQSSVLKNIESGCSRDEQNILNSYLTAKFVQIAAIKFTFSILYVLNCSDRIKHNTIRLYT